MDDLHSYVEGLSEHLRECWPLLLNDGLQREVAMEAIDFLAEKLR